MSLLKLISRQFLLLGLAAQLFAPAYAQAPPIPSSSWSDVQSHISGGRYSEAEQIVRRMASQLENMSGSNQPLQLAYAYLELTFLLEVQDLQKEADELFAKLISMAGPAFANDPQKIANWVDGIGVSLRAVSRIRESLSAFRRARSLFQNISHNDFGVALTSVAIGDLLVESARFSEAQPFFEEAIEVSNAVAGPIQAGVAYAIGRAVFGLGIISAVDGDLRQSEAYLDEAFAHVNYEWGGDGNNERLGPIYGALGVVKFWRGDHKEARRYFVKALELSEKLFGPSAPQLVNTLLNLYAVDAAASEVGQAEQWRRRAESICSGREVQFSASCLPLDFSAIADLSEKKQFSDAAAKAKDLRAFTENKLGRVPFWLALRLSKEAEAFQESGNLDSAAEAYQAAIAILEREEGALPRSSAALKHQLAGIYYRLGRYTEAETQYRRSMSIIDLDEEPRHPNDIYMMLNFGSFLTHEGNIEEAQKFLEKAYDFHVAANQSDGERDPQFGLALAELYGVMGRREDAAKLFAEVRAKMKNELVEIPIYVGTNRRPLVGMKSGFGSDPAPASVLSSVRVTVVAAPQKPRKELKGYIGSSQPSITAVDQMRVETTTVLAPEIFVRESRHRLLNARDFLGQSLVVVHGYNVSFDDAVKRAGQIALDLNFDGPVFLFSWPTKGGTSYFGDRDLAQASGTALRAFLDGMIRSSRAGRINIIAHSMGNVVLHTALEGLSDDRFATLNIAEVILASPDLDAALLEILVSRLQLRGAKATVYAASNDRALEAAQLGKGRTPVGLISDGRPPRLVAGVDLIDVTVLGGWPSMNHSLYADQKEIIADIRRLMLQGARPADLRTKELKRIDTEAGSYWRYELPALRK